MSWVRAALILALGTASCDGGARAPRPAATVPVHSSAPAAVGLPELSVLPRPKGPSFRLGIARPTEGEEVAPNRAPGFAVELDIPASVSEVALAAKGSLELSLDGARPRPVAARSIALARLLDPGSVLGPGAHDLVATLVDPSGVALDPGPSGVTAVRFFVGARPPQPAPARLVCRRPFGTYYGKGARPVLDFVLLHAGSAGAVVTIEGEGSKRQARAMGPGPFELGDLASGEYRVTLEAVSAGSTLPAACLFVLNRELEPSP